ncbi:hypothetical protein D9758_002820 [Tetrapyrgos nigripes]|uniref:Uncharacterized protein n=1 Tax=Tetrapyrgos nigripes TaxID=182062 RepID=A0A8H5GQY5_9AGAR|nr:hypothetical protein D9758_002820 [Tetrapyrgos nigripes]
MDMSAFRELSTNKDLQDTIEFFKARTSSGGKDTSKFDMAMNQAIDGIKARIAYLEHSSSDLETWLKEWKNKGASLH